MRRAYLATFEIMNDDDTSAEKTVRVWSVARGYNLMELLFPDRAAFLVRIAVEWKPVERAPGVGEQLKLFLYAH